MTSSLYIALCSLLFLYLSGYVIHGRRLYRVSLGHGEKIPLLKRVRAHANFSEYTPIFLLLLFVSEHVGLAVYAIHLFGCLFVLARIGHAYGLLKAERISSGSIQGLKFRMYSIITTFFCIGSLAIYLLYRYMMMFA